MIVNLPKIRIAKYPQGYVVEVQKTTWHGRKYWVHADASAGIDTMPWYYQTYEAAMKEFLNQLSRYISFTHLNKQYEANT